jgi:hypothetical protein
MKDYKHDIAISLCKEDVAYAKELVKTLNPNLNLFFYEDRQEQLIGELGPEKFGDVFKHDARIVVILYRKKWGDSYYTELERSAILDRTARPDQGQSFIMVIGMEPGAVPGWYPSSRIYANPMKFSVEKMAEFIEHKVNERGGNVVSLTFEEIVEQAEQKRKDKIAHVRFLHSSDSRDEALLELELFVKEVSQKIDSAMRRDLGVRIGRRDFNSEPYKTFQNAEVYFQLGNLQVRIAIEMGRMNPKQYYSQAKAIHVFYEELENQQHAFEMGRDMGRYKVLKNTEYRFNTDRRKLKGWSEVEAIQESNPNSRTGIFLGFNRPYDLKRIIPTKELVDDIFKEFFRIFEKKFPVNF